MTLSNLQLEARAARYLLHPLTYCSPLRLDAVVACASRKDQIMLQNRLEMVQLLARFKLSVRRHLQIAVDLQLLEVDPVYARRVLAAIEAAAEDEQLLILTLQVRDRVLPPLTPPMLDTAGLSRPDSAGVADATTQTRSYMYGARGF